MAAALFEPRRRQTQVFNADEMAGNKTELGSRAPLTNVTKEADRQQEKTKNKGKERKAIGIESHGWAGQRLSFHLPL